MTDPNSDAELVTAACSGDEAAFHQLVDRHGPALLALCQSILHHHPDAQDAAQDAILRAYLKLGDLRDRHSFGAWLRQIAYRACTDCLKRSQPDLFQPDAELTLPGAVDEPHEALERRELKEKVRDAVKRLPAHYRVPVMLRDIEGLSYSDVAKVLGVPQGTAKSHVFMGRKLLRELLEPFMTGEIQMSQIQGKRDVNLFPNFTDRARLAITLARQEAAGKGVDAGVVDLAVGLVELPDREPSLLREHGAEKIGGLPGGLGGLLMKQHGISADELRTLRLAADGTEALASVLRSASRLAAELHHAYVGTEHLLLGIVSQDIGSKMLHEHGLTQELVRAEIARRT